MSLMGHYFILFSIRCRLSFPLFFSFNNQKQSIDMMPIPVKVRCQLTNYYYYQSIHRDKLFDSVNTIYDHNKVITNHPSVFLKSRKQGAFRSQAYAKVTNSDKVLLYNKISFSWKYFRKVQSYIIQAFITSSQTQRIVLNFFTDKQTFITI